MFWSSLGRKMWIVALAGAVAGGCSDDGLPATDTSGTGDGGPTSADGGTSGMTNGMTSMTSNGMTTMTTSMDTGSGDNGTMDPGSSGGSSSDSGSSSGTSGSTSGSSSSSSSGGAGMLDIGEECTGDGQCVTNVCWDFADYDPFCGGAACSTTCVVTQDCVDAFVAAGAMFPGAAECGLDGRCSPLGTGFGLYYCAQ